jgi:hypothetical protein
MKVTRSLVTLTAVGAVALAAFAGAASASAAEFQQSEKESALHGAQMNTHVISVQGSEITCTTAVFAGKGGASLSEPTQTVHPEYSGCTAFSFEGATINTVGCSYKFYAETSLSGGAEAPVDLAGCTVGFLSLTLEAPFGLAKCVVHVPNQTGINGQTYANKEVSGKKVVEVTTNSNNSRAEVLTSTGFCPLKIGSTTMIYKGTTTVEGNEGASALTWG